VQLRISLTSSLLGALSASNPGGAVAIVYQSWRVVSCVQVSRETELSSSRNQPISPRPYHFYINSKCRVPRRESHADTLIVDSSSNFSLLLCSGDATHHLPAPQPNPEGGAIVPLCQGQVGVSAQSLPSLRVTVSSSLIVGLGDKTWSRSLTRRQSIIAESTGQEDEKASFRLHWEGSSLSRLGARLSQLEKHSQTHNQENPLCYSSLSSPGPYHTSPLLCSLIFLPVCN
jgi:hypothetical protein